MTIHLCVLETYDKVGASAETLYFATKGFTSTPSDTPANTFFDPRVKVPASIRRTMFAPGRTFGQSQVGFGDLVLINEDGGLDFLEDYAFDGRSITQYRGPEGAAFPGGYTKGLVATMEQAIPDSRSYRIKIRDRQDEVDIPLQPTKYDGDNSLPAGLEGVAGDLKGKPKPICYGVVKNIAPPLVNTSKLIYQVNDGTVASVDEVYDAGIQLKKSVWDWTLQTTPDTNHMFSMAYDPDDNQRWVAVGFLGKCMTSDDDGVTWTARTSSFGSSQIGAVVWASSLSLFVAVGASGKIATSPDGITWTQRTSTFDSSGTIYAIAWDGTTLVAGGATAAAAPEIETSTDGTTWTSRTPGGSTYPLSMAAGRNLFVSGRTAGEIWTSSDSGVTWTQVTETPSAENIRSIAFGKGRFVFASEDTTQVGYSENGTVWTLGTNFADEATTLFREVKFSNLLGKFIMCGLTQAYNTIIATSPDGNVWSVSETDSVLSATPTSVGANDTAVLVSAVGGGLITIEAAGNYASEADLLDDTKEPAPGQYKAYLTGGYIRLGSPPAGLITADVTQGAAASDRTAGQIFTDVLVKAGLTSSDWTAADITTLDSSLSDVIGYWSGITEVLASDVLSMIAESIIGWWGIDAIGSFRIKELLSPAAGTSVLTITANDMVKHLRRTPPKDPGRGIPSYRSIVRYAKNYTVQDRDLAGGVSDVRRAELSREWAEVADTDATVQTAHLLAREQAYHTLLAVAADAITAAARVQALRGVKRSPYTFAVPHNSDFEGIDMGDIVTIEHDRFGLSAGVKMAVMELEPQPNQGLINVGVWG